MKLMLSLFIVVVIISISLGCQNVPVAEQVPEPPTVVGNAIKKKISINGIDFFVARIENKRILVAFYESGSYDGKGVGLAMLELSDTEPFEAEE